MEQNNQVAIINKSLEVFKTAPEILKANQERTQKALVVGNRILADWHTAWAIQDEDEKLAALAALDVRSNNYIVNCANALSQEREQRAAITQMMDNFKDMFFEAERDIDKGKAGTAPSKVQANRDAYAKEAFQIKERRRKEAEERAAKEREAISVRAEVETKLFTEYNEKLRAKKIQLSDALNNVTLATYDATLAKMQNYKPVLDSVSLSSPILAKYHTREEIEAISLEILNTKLKEFNANWTAELSLHRDDLVDKFPSQKAAIEEEIRLLEEQEAAAKLAQEAKTKKDIEAAAKRQEELRIQKEQADKAADDRRQAEQKRIDDEALEAKQREDLAITLKKESADTMTMFEKEATIAEAPGAAGQIRQGYEITVLHPVGYTQIFQLWFEQEGRNLPVDKIGATKMEAMKTYCEKLAVKGTKIDSKFLTYEESFKAVNRKAKATA